MNKSDWAELRRQCAVRDHNRCWRCYEKMYPPLATAHHLIPREDGGPDLLSNLAWLCNPCHDFVEVAGLADRPSIEGSFKPSSAYFPMSDHADVIREALDEWRGYSDPGSLEDAALDALVVERDGLRKEYAKWAGRAQVAEAERDEALRQRDEYEVIAYPSRKGNFRAALAKEDTDD